MDVEEVVVVDDDGEEQESDGVKGRSDASTEPEMGSVHNAKFVPHTASMSS